MPDFEIVKLDQGGVNARIIAKEAKVDFRRVEAASLKMPTRFTSAEGKRSFVRMFNTLQLNTHFISVIARTRLDHDDIGKIETAIRAQMDAATAAPSIPQVLNASISPGYTVKPFPSTTQAPFGTLALAPTSVMMPLLSTTVPFSITAPLTVTIRASWIATNEGTSASSGACHSTNAGQSHTARVCIF